MQLGSTITGTNTGNKSTNLFLHSINYSIYTSVFAGHNWLNSMTPRFNMTNVKSVLNMNNLTNVNSPPSMLTNVNCPPSIIANVNSPANMLSSIDENHFRAALNLNNQNCDGSRLPPKIPRLDIPGAGFMPPPTFTPNIQSKTYIQI